MRSSLPLKILATCLSARFSRLGSWLLCLVAGGLIYAPALGGDLIWDDCYLVRENPFFRSPVFGWEVFRHYLFLDSFSTYYRPIQNWSYMLDYWLWRGDPVGYHLTNILLHGGSGVLLFELLRQLLPGMLGSAARMGPRANNLTAGMLALIWTVHPVHNAAVAYISGRADSLASLFALLAWLLARGTARIRSPLATAALAGASALAMLLALCSKEIALLWLAIFALHTLLFERAWPWRVKLRAVCGAVAVLAAYAVLHALPESRAAPVGGPPALLEERVLLAFRALGDYTRLLVWPDRLYMERTLSQPGIYRSIAAWREHAGYELLSLGGLLAGATACGLCGWRGPGRPLRVFGALWFFAAFLPISNLSPLNAEVAEHWIYLASIGALLLAAGVVVAFPQRVQLALGAVAFLAAGALGWRTSVRAGDWVNAETFCARTIQDGGATPRILTTLASVYGERRDFVSQEAILRKLTAHFPDYTPARINLGICLSQQGRTAEAEPLLRVEKGDAEIAASRFPRTWRAALHLAQLHQKARRRDDALTVLAEARARFPATWELVKYEGELRAASAGPAAALPPVAEFANAHWWHLDAWITLGRLRSLAGQPDEAIAALRAASRLDIYNAGPLAGIARIEFDRDRPAAALPEQLSALTREPKQPQHYLMLGTILEKLGRQNEALSAVRKAQSLAADARDGS